MTELMYYGLIVARMWAKNQILTLDDEQYVRGHNAALEALIESIDKVFKAYRVGPADGHDGR